MLYYRYEKSYGIKILSNDVQQETETELKPMWMFWCDGCACSTDYLNEVQRLEVNHWPHTGNPL
jgi:hypothetical protein